MLKIVMYLTIVLLCQCASKKKEQRIQLSTSQLNGDSSEYRFMKMYDNPDSLFLILLDSAKKCQPNMKIPTFFYNYRLDYEAPWISFHDPKSLRKTIFDSIENVYLLEKIIVSNDNRLKMVADSIKITDSFLLKAIPYTKVSNYEMAKQRLKEIKTENLKR